MDAKPNSLLATIYERLVSSEKSKIVYWLKSFLSLFLSSTINLSDGSTVIEIKPLLIEAYYWNSEANWEDPYVRKNDAQNGANGTFIHPYLKSIPKRKESLFLNKRNGLDIVIGNKDGVFLSFLLKRSIVFGQEMTECQLANTFSAIFAPSDHSCPSIVSSLVLGESVPTEFFTRHLTLPKNDDEEFFHDLQLAAKRKTILDVILEATNNEN